MCWAGHARQPTPITLRPRQGPRNRHWSPCCTGHSDTGSAWANQLRQHALGRAMAVQYPINEVSEQDVASGNRETRL